MQHIDADTHKTSLHATLKGFPWFCCGGWCGGECSTATMPSPQGGPAPQPYLRARCRAAQPSFTSLCFWETPGARAGWRFDSWETFTFSI